MMALRVYVVSMTLVLVASLGSVAYVAFCLSRTGGF